MPDDNRRLHIRQRIQAVDDDIVKRRRAAGNNREKTMAFGYMLDMKSVQDLSTDATVDELAIALLGGPEAVRVIGKDVLVGEPNSNERWVALDRWMAGLKSSRGMQ